MKNEQQQIQQSTLDHGATHLLGNKTRRVLWQWLPVILLYIGLFTFLKVILGASPSSSLVGITLVYASIFAWKLIAAIKEDRRTAIENQHHAKVGSDEGAHATH